jgi:hypothetical protein
MSVALPGSMFPLGATPLVGGTNFAAEIPGSPS